MSNVVSWNLQLAVRDGQLENARELMKEMVESTRTESGCKNYEWFISADSSTVHINESYSDSDATLAHLGNFGANFVERFMGCFQPTAFYVYGEPSDAVKSVVDGFGAQYLGTLGGFRR